MDERVDAHQELVAEASGERTRRRRPRRERRHAGRAEPGGHGERGGQPVGHGVERLSCAGPTCAQVVDGDEPRSRRPVVAAEADGPVDQHRDGHRPLRGDEPGEHAVVEVVGRGQHAGRLGAGQTGEVLPIVTPEEMRVIDAWAPEPEEVLIERAGAAVARVARRMLGGTYGRTVVVVAGKGNNGADGRVAARLLAGRGVRVRVVDAAAPGSIGAADLVIDAAYGTGFRGSWSPPDVGDAPVLAVDVPSGVDALTGEAGGDVLAATRTITFAALKPGLLVPPGSEMAGQVEVADIGLDVSSAHAHLVQRADVAAWWPQRPLDAHKWQQAVRIVAGSPTMTGAAVLASHAAMRAGAGMVALSVPGQLAAHAPLEVVQRELPRSDWAGPALDSLERFKAVVCGPGLGRSDSTAADVRRFVVEAALPMVVDGDALFALAWSSDGAADLLRRRRAPTVLTPHDGEYKLLTGQAPVADRLVAARRLAADTRLRRAAQGSGHRRRRAARCHAGGDGGRRAPRHRRHGRRARRAPRCAARRRADCGPRCGGRGVGARARRAARARRRLRRQ